MKTTRFLLPLLLLLALLVAPARAAEYVIAQIQSNPVNLAFVHFRDPDTAGHSKGWDTLPYRQALINVDEALSRMLAMIEEHPQLAGRTAVVVTSDHGGHGKRHGDMSDLRDYMIPFFAWGAGVAEGDLYKMNPDTREDPRRANVPYDAEGQPVRNGDMGNLALHLLGLDPIPGSTINARQDLNVTTPAPATQPAQN